MPKATRLYLAVGLCVLAAAVAHAQRGGAGPMIQIYASVLDNKGAPVPGLSPADFVVKEDGVVREVIEARISDEPLQIALLVDDSEAATDATIYLREGVLAFLERLHGRAETALITLGERPTVVENYTKDTEALKQRARRIFPRSGSGTYLLDAVMDASRALAKREAARPVIVAVVFEGIDYSNRPYQQVLDELKKSGVALHVIVVGTPSSSMSDEMRNRNIVIADGTERSGGRRDQVLTVSGLPDKLKQAADELLNQYLLTYTRPERLVPPEKVEVSSTKRNLTVRARNRVADR